jgi:alpha-L-fucosidase
VTTQKGNKVFVHVLDWADPALLLPQLPDRVTAAYTLKDHGKVEFSKTDDGVLLKLPTRAASDFDLVIVLEQAPR